MIDSCLVAGCLCEVLDEMHKQEAERIQYMTWLIRGRGSYQQYKEKLNGRRG